MRQNPTVPVSEIEFRYVRSSGPGGQNVNKVSSKAVLRWPIVASKALADDVRARFLDRFRGRVTTEGDVVLTCDRFRDRERNREECLAKLEAMLAEVARPPRPRKKTRPGRAAHERRLDEKKATARKKEARMKPSGEA